MKAWIPISALLVWAVRDTGRRPAPAVLLGIVLASAAALTAAVLLLAESLNRTAAAAMDRTPALVARRVNPGGWGWMPLPSAEAVARARTVAGVTRAEARIWGTADAHGTTVTVVGLDRRQSAAALPAEFASAVVPGQAIVGPGVPTGANDGSLVLQGVGIDTLTVAVAGRLGPGHSLSAHDVVFLAPDDARRILGLAAHQASDLALEVFHLPEAEALRADLAAALPWPVQMTTRREAKGRYAAQVAHRAGIVTVLMAPALLAMAFIAAAAAGRWAGRPRDMGLLKALGWTTADVVRLQLYRALLVGLPAVSVGLAVAYGAVFWPGIGWPGRFLLGWRTLPPHLNLDATGAGWVLLQVAALVLLPYVAAVLLPTIRRATAGNGLLEVSHER